MGRKVVILNGEGELYALAKCLNEGKKKLGGGELIGLHEEAAMSVGELRKKYCGGSEGKKILPTSVSKGYQHRRRVLVHR